jgi:uncharacterized protein (DUF1697 family)
MIKNLTPMTYIALFRGINVGKAKRVAMAQLRAMIEGLGYRNVRTLLNSGNVVLESSDSPDDVRTRIEQAMVKKLHVSSNVTVLTAKELATAVAENPLLEVADNPSRFLIAVLRDPTNRKKLLPFMKQAWGDDKLAVGRRVVYLWCPNGFLDSEAANAVNKLLGDNVTVRNWATTLKLHAMCGPA